MKEIAWFWIEILKKRMVRLIQISDITAVITKSKEKMAIQLLMDENADLKSEMDLLTDQKMQVRFRLGK